MGGAPEASGQHSMSARRRGAPVPGGAGLRDGESGGGPSGLSSDFILSDVADPGLAAAGLARIGWLNGAGDVQRS
jgi:hypothetical protein